MNIRRVVLTEEPYPTCAVSGKKLGYFNPIFEITREDGKVVHINYASINTLLKTIGR